jgi:hypothetical protein
MTSVLAVLAISAKNVIIGVKNCLFSFHFEIACNFCAKHFRPINDIIS